METKDNNQTGTQGVKIWSESEIHNQVMKDLDSIHGVHGSYHYFNGEALTYHVKALTKERALFIAKRGNKEEILHMIHRYGKTIFYPNNSQYYSRIENAVLPECVQIIIAESKDVDLIRTYLSYWGFDKLGQEVVIERGDHEELMYYIDRHGFQPKQQRMLLARGNEEEINLHIQKHGLADDIVDDIFTRIANQDETAVNEFYRFIQYQELSIELQKRMIATVKTPEFEAYVNKYGLWNQTHKELVICRSLPEINYYLGIHKYLYYDAEAIYLAVATADNRYHYVENKPNAIGLTINNLLQEDVLDYPLLSKCFLKEKYDNVWTNEEREIKDMPHDKLMQYISKNSLSPYGLAALFFRNNKEEFEAYVNRKFKK